MMRMGVRNQSSPPLVEGALVVVPKFVTRQIMLDAEQVKDRTMASFNHPGLPS